MVDDLLYVSAHGESWEVAATRSIGERIQKIIEEHINNRDRSETGGTFELHYTPGKARGGNSITIPLASDYPSTRDHQSNHHLANGVRHDANPEKTLRF